VGCGGDGLVVGVLEAPGHHHPRPQRSGEPSLSSFSARDSPSFTVLIRNGAEEERGQNDLVEV
jgi:hypothetical protein